jgi:hypothetical protein
VSGYIFQNPAILSERSESKDWRDQAVNIL